VIFFFFFFRGGKGMVFVFVFFWAKGVSERGCEREGE